MSPVLCQVRNTDQLKYTDQSVRARARVRTRVRARPKSRARARSVGLDLIP